MVMIKCRTILTVEGFGATSTNICFGFAPKVHDLYMAQLTQKIQKIQKSEREKNAQNANDHGDHGCTEWTFLAAGRGHCHRMDS